MSLIISDIYNELTNSYKYLKRIEILKRVIFLNFLNKRKKESYYLPGKIEDTVNRKFNTKLNYQLLVNKRNISLNFYLDDNSSISQNLVDIYSNNSFMIIIFLLNYTKSVKDLHIDIFLTDFKKELPVKEALLDVLNINSGYSYGDNNNSYIVIYRYEEWYKVLIHELFHALDLDFSSMPFPRTKEKMKNYFNINSNYNLYETYCESWARILNVAVFSFLKNINSKKNYIVDFNENIKLETRFSLYQCNKILEKTLIEKRKERTNVFAYYVLTAVIMLNRDNFIKWCKDNNNNVLDFTKDKENIDEFLNFIIEKFNDESFINALLKTRGFKSYDNSLRMTIVEI
tara:strand:- start:22388 stop:23419 length:1032 start_codon:yes stop_codon:yes gene_type:complete